jgi:hypothetical protein
VSEERSSFLPPNKETIMSYVNLPRLAGVAGLAATLFMAGAVLSTAQAGNSGRQRVHAEQGAGGSWSHSSTAQRTPSGHTRQDHWQTQGGKSASRRVDVTNDAASGTRNRSVVWTGPEGGHTMVDTVTRATGSGYTRDTTATRDDGRTATRSTTVMNDRAAGTRAVDSTATGFNGRTTMHSSDTRRTDDGYVRDVTRTSPGGQVNQRSVDVSCDAAVQSCTRTVTGGNGD